MRFSKGLDRFYNTVDRSVHFFGVFAAILLFLLCPVAFYEIVARKLGSPTVWAFHVLSYMQIFIIWFAIAYAQKNREHVSVDLVTMYLPLKLRVITRVLSTFICVVISAVLCWQGWRLVWRSYSNKLMTVEELHHPIYWIQIPVVIGAILLFLVFIRQILADIQWLATMEGKPEGI